jgi:hypothetical protein
MPVILMILGFMCWWPLGLIILGYLIARRRYGYWEHPMFAWNGPWGGSCGTNGGSERWERKMAHAQEKMERVRSKMERFTGRGDWFGGGAGASSGNSAFDDYRTETLKRLEDEQREFKEFLGRLRFAKDRAELEKFMTERRERPLDPGQQGGEPPAQPQS